MQVPQHEFFIRLMAFAEKLYSGGSHNPLWIASLPYGVDSTGPLCKNRHTYVLTYSLSKKIITTIHAYIHTSVTFNDPLHVQAELVSYVFSNPLYECHFQNKAGTHVILASHHGSHEKRMLLSRQQRCHYEY